MAAPRRPLAGFFLLALILLSALAELQPGIPGWAAGVAAWLAAALLWRDLARPRRHQALALIILGVIGLFVAGFMGGPVDIPRLLAQNQPLLAMLAGISFLQLAMPTGPTNEAGTQGRGAFLRTLAGTHVVGAVLNLSIIPIVANRLFRHHAPDMLSLRLLTRGYTSAVFWSPLFAGMATALVFAPGSSWLALAGLGAPLAVFSLAYAYLSARLVESKAQERFVGYPFHAGALALPAILGTLILGGHQLLPAWNVLVLIGVLGPLVAAGWLLGRRPVPEAGRHLGDHISTGLPGIRGELILFLAAGVLATGLSALIQSVQIPWMPETLDASTASLLLALISVLAIAGLHPLIGIAVVASLTAPLDPEPDLLALTFVMAWAIGTSTSPLSATQVLLKGAFGVPGRRILVGNAAYGLALYIVCVAALHGYETLGML